MIQQPTGQITGQMTGQINRRRRRRPKGPMARLLISTDFALLWLKHCMTALGDALFATTLMIWLATAMHSPLYLGLALAAFGLPYALGGPFAEAASERWSRRKIMFVTDVVRGILTFFLLLVLLPVFSPHRALALICLLCFFMGAMSRFSQAAQRAALNVIVPPSEHARGISRVQGSVALITIFGPVLAALLFVLLGQNPVPGLVLASFVLLLSAGGAQAMDRRLTQKVMAVRARQRQRGLRPDGRPLTADDLANEAAQTDDDADAWTGNIFKAGWAAALGGARLVMQRPFGSIARLVALIALLGGAFNVLEVYFVNGYLHRPFVFTGMILSAHATGILLGSAWFQRLDAHLRPTTIFGYAVLGMGLTTAGFASSRAFTAGLLWAAALGITNGLMLFAAQTALLESGERRQFPQRLVGYDLLTALAGVVGILLGGLLARVLTVDTVLGGISVMLLAVGLLAVFLLTRQAAPAQRRPQRAPAPPADEADEDATYQAYDEQDVPADDQMPAEEPGEDGELPQMHDEDGAAWEQAPAGPPAPQAPLPRGSTRLRAAPWEQGSEAGRGLGVRGRFGPNEDE